MLIGFHAKKHRVPARSQDLEKGGAFLKEWEKCKRPWPEYSLFLNQFHTVCPKIETKFLGKLRNSSVFSAQNQVVSKKKKKRSSPKLRLIFRPKSEIQAFFPPKIRWSPKKKKNWDWFFGRNRKFKGFFRPKSGGLQKKKKVFTEIETDFSGEIGNSSIFSAQNQVVSKEKKKIEADISAEIGNSSVFSAQNQVVSKKKKKKGLHRNWDWLFGRNRKFKRFFRPKSGGLQRKKKIETDFSAEIGNSSVFSAQNQVVSRKKKKKRSSPKLGLIFRPNAEIQTFEGGCFPMWGLFSIFHKNSASKAPKTCDLAYFTSQWYATDRVTVFAH